MTAEMKEEQREKRQRGKERIKGKRDEERKSETKGSGNEGRTKARIDDTGSAVASDALTQQYFFLIFIKAQSS